MHSQEFKKSMFLIFYALVDYSERIHYTPCCALFEPLQGLCYQTWVLHGCRRFVHGRGDPQEDLLSPGDPAWGRRETPAHWVAAAAGQGPLPAFPIATREDISVTDTRWMSQVSSYVTTALFQQLLQIHTHTHRKQISNILIKIYVPGVDPMLIKQKVCASATQTQLMGVHVCFLEKEACQRRRKLTVHRLVLLMFHIHPVIITSRPWGFSHLPTQNNADNVANPTRSKPKTRRSVTWWGFCEVRLSTACEGKTERRAQPGLCCH